MQNCFTEACTKIDAYRSAYPGNKKGFHISWDDITDLKAANGGSIDGIRGYYALEDTGKFTVFFLGTVKDAAGNYNDVNETTATVKARPCPLMCSITAGAFT
jgi:hypothetical protein